MPSHWQFGHLQPKLWAKEGPGVKLAVWLPTTKSRESMPSRHPIWVCDMGCKDLDEGYNFDLDLVAIQVRSRELWRCKVLGVPPGQFRDNFGTPFWESREFVPLGCRCGGASQSILYGGWWWHPSSPGRGESCGPKCPWLVPTPKGVPECELTTWVVCFCADSSLIN